jgi:putative iron-only hydrogenase system regulator
MPSTRKFYSNKVADQLFFENHYIECNNYMHSIKDKLQIHFELCKIFNATYIKIKRGGSVEKRIGVVGIIVENREKSKEVNDILHKYGEIILGRMGLPYKEREVSVISLIVDGTTDEISAMTGKLGNISEVQVKAAFTTKGSSKK